MKGKPMGIWLQWYGVLWALQKIDPSIRADTYDLKGLIDSTLRLPENILNISQQLGISNQGDYVRYELQANEVYQ